MELRFRFVNWWKVKFRDGYDAWDVFGFGFDKNDPIGFYAFFIDIFNFEFRIEVGREK